MKKRKTRIKTIEKTYKTAGELIAAGSLCAWRECGAHFKGEMPAGWNYLLVYWHPEPQPFTTLAEVATSNFCSRDAVLCVEHSRELESNLVDIARWVDRPVSGSA